jgi:hypothetical protein
MQTRKDDTMTNEGNTHSFWVLCPEVREGDDFSIRAKPVTCHYCREHLVHAPLRPQFIVEADALRQEGESE